jgi:hypothetical protein
MVAMVVRLIVVFVGCGGSGGVAAALLLFFYSTN